MDDLAKANQELRTQKAILIDDHLFVKGDISPAAYGVLIQENALNTREFGGEKHPASITLLDKENRILASGWTANPDVIRKKFPVVEIVDSQSIVDMEAFLLEKGVAKPSSQRQLRQGAI